jgi:homogentisate 1,2-dioxygenase
VKSQDRLSDHYFEHYPLDVVGWDGWVYPIAFNIMDYQPKTGAIHLPPTIHTTFASRSDARGVGARYVICSFVPRMLDYREGAIPCPYHHSSPDCDEMLFYVDGNFTSRRGIQPGSISLHPTGIPHGPHPGTYEKSIGVKRTDELAVMMDTYTPMRLTEIGKAIEAPEYQETWL